MNQYRNAQEEDHMRNDVIYSSNVSDSYGAERKQSLKVYRQQLERELAEKYKDKIPVVKEAKFPRGSIKIKKSFGLKIGSMGQSTSNNHLGLNNFFDNKDQKNA